MIPTILLNSLCQIFIFDKIIACLSFLCLRSNFVLTGFLIEIAAWRKIQTSFPSHKRTRIDRNWYTRDIKLSLIRRLHLASAYKDRLLSCARAWQLMTIFSFQTARLYIFSDLVQCRPAYDIFARDRLTAKPRIHISATNTPLKFFNMSMHDQLFTNPTPCIL